MSGCEGCLGKGLSESWGLCPHVSRTFPSLRDQCSFKQSPTFLAWSHPPSDLWLLPKASWVLTGLPSYSQHFHIVKPNCHTSMKPGPSLASRKVCTCACACVCVCMHTDLGTLLARPIDCWPAPSTGGLRTHNGDGGMKTPSQC